MNNLPKRDAQLFAELLQVPLDERDAYLNHACGDDVALRQRLKKLLEANDELGDFLDIPSVMSVKVRSAVSIGEKTGDWIGRYKLLEQIGEGGCGVVFLAEQQEPVRREVALKVIKPGMDTKSVIARFEAERQALALMNHPNIAKVFDAGATGSCRPYFVMELVRGAKITDYCDKHSLATEERLALFIQVCQAIQHAHQKGIIHRDIKPSNILVTITSTGEPLPVVIDFGVAKATNNQVLTDKTLFTAFNMLIGTPAYMSPEQATLASADVDTRTDIYSLGVLLYELLTSSTPFDTEALLKSGLDEVRRVIREEDPVRPSTRLSRMTKENLTTVAQRRQSEPTRLVRAVSGDLDWIVMKAMEKDRARRFETANSLALDVEHFLANEAISARPPSAVYKFQKLVQRNKLLFLGIGVIGVLLLTGLIILSTLLEKERQARQESDQVTEILSDMMRGAGPAIAQGRDSKEVLLDILSPTSERVGTELQDQPAVQAQLCSLLASTYMDIGNYDQAEKLYRIALADEQELYGSKSAEAADSLYDLGTTLWHHAKWAEAEKPLREALSIRRQLFSTTNADVAASMNGLGCDLREEWKLTEADPLIRQALEIRRYLFPGNNLEVAESLRSVCHLDENERRWSEADTNAVEYVDMCRHLKPERQDLVAEALDDLAMSAGYDGKPDVQAASHKEAFEIKEKLYPEDHPFLVKSIENLGEIMRLQGKTMEAHAVLLGVISIQSQILGRDYPDTLASMGSLGQVLASEGNWAEAEKVHREALRLWRKRLGDENATTLWEWGQLCSSLVAQGKFNEADQLLAEVLTPGFLRDPACADLLAYRRDLMARQGKWREALTDATLVVKYQPADYYRWYTLVALLAITRNRAAYESACPNILAMFANTTNPYIDVRVADDCLFLPNSGADLNLVDKLADKAVSIGNGWSDEPYFQVAKAMSAYRLGHFTEAIGWAQKTLKGPIIYPNAQAYAIMAMANWKLGQKHAAWVMLDKGNSLTPDISPSDKAIDLGDSWTAWIEARISLDEAAALILPSSKGQSDSQQP